jgi:hypothetical protein
MCGPHFNQLPVSYGTASKKLASNSCHCTLSSEFTNGSCWLTLFYVYLKIMVGAGDICMRDGSGWRAGLVPYARVPEVPNYYEALRRSSIGY